MIRKATNRLYAFLMDSGLRLFSLANSSNAFFFAFLACTTLAPVGGGGAPDELAAAPPKNTEQNEHLIL